MSKNARVMKNLAERLPDSFMRTDILVHRREYRYIIHGLELERTSYKDTYRARTQVLPFFKFSDLVYLTYSDRIENCTPGSLPQTFAGSSQEVADQIYYSMIQLGLVEQLQQPYTLSDFLKQYDRSEYETGGVEHEVFDMACTAAMVGDVGCAERYLLNIKRIHEQDVMIATSKIADHYVQLHTQVLACLNALAKGPDHLRDHIVAAVTRNARHLGFEPVGPAQQTAP